MPSRIEIDGVPYELGGAMLELVNCGARTAEFSLLLVGKRRETYWLTGTIVPPPRDLDAVDASRFHVGESSLEDLFAVLTGWRRPIHTVDPAGVVLRAQRQGHNAFYISSSFGFAKPAPRLGRAVIEMTAHVVGLHVGSSQ
jgi:hypothetical protein